MTRHTDDRARPEPAADPAAAPEEQPEQAEPKQLSAAPVEPEDEMEKLVEERDRYMQGWQRAQAELENFRKRMEREQRHWNERILRDVLSGVLDVIDLFDRALEADAAGGDHASFVEGMTMVRGELERLIEARGATRVPAAGAPFDPAHHEALMAEQRDDLPDNTVIDEVRRGYRLGDFVLRPAQVRVARGGPKAAPPAPEAGGAEEEGA